MNESTTRNTADGAPVILETIADPLIDNFLEAMRLAGRQCVIVHGRPEESESFSAFACPRCGSNLDDAHIVALSEWARRHLANNVEAIR
jgi:hypothetical protein